jgi:hypothetical protein
MSLDAHSKIHYVDDRCCFGSREDVTLSIWRGAPTMDRIAAQRSVLERCIARYKPVYSLTAFRAVDMTTAQLTDDRIRKEFEKLGKMMDGVLYAHALVIIGTGFIAATLRSAAVSLGMLMRSRVVIKSFDNIDVAGKWLVSQRQGGTRPHEAEAVATLLRAMTAQLDEHALRATAAR